MGAVGAFAAILWQVFTVNRSESEHVRNRTCSAETSCILGKLKGECGTVDNLAISAGTSFWVSVPTHFEAVVCFCW